MTKHMPNTDTLYGNLLTFSSSRPEINKYLEEVIQGKHIFGTCERIGGVSALITIIHKFRNFMNFQMNCLLA